MSGTLGFWVGMLFAFVACGIMIAIGRSVAARRDAALTVALELPFLRSSVAVLEAATHAERLFVETSLTSHEELAAAYVLPVGSSASRLVASLDDIADALAQRGVSVRIHRVDSGPASQPNDEGVVTAPITLTISTDDRTAARFLEIVELGSSMLVRDALEPMAERALLSALDASAPGALPAAARFLATDLLDYAAQPDVVEGRMFADVPSDIADRLRALLLRHGLGSVRSALGDIAPMIRATHAWPLPLVRVESFVREGDRLTIVLTAFSRART